MQFRCRIPAGWRFFVPLCNTQHGAYESDSSLHRRLFADGNFEKNRRGGCAGSGPARRKQQCGGRSGRRYKCRRRQRGKGVHDNRPDACGRKIRHPAGRCGGGIRRAGIRGPRGACGIGETAGDSRRGNTGRSAGGVRQPGFRDGGRTTGGVRRRAGFRSRGGRGFRGRTLVQHARHADRRRTSRCAGPRRSDRFRSAHRPKACARRDPIDAAKLREPHTPLLSKLRFIRFVLGYRRRQKRNPVALLPAGDAARCTQCGRCVALCPTQAIARGDELHTDPARCIRCCACVKGCAFGARTFETPFAAILSRNFARRKPPVTLM